MASWRDQKNAARRIVHETMFVDAFYVATRGAPPVPVKVRLHNRFDALGQLKEVAGYAEAQSQKPKAVFLREEVSLPKTKSVLYVDATEAYAINNVQPPDGITITAEITVLSPSQIAMEQITIPEGS